jgi:hypothetical protein
VASSVSGDGEAERLGGREVERKLELDRLLHRQVGGLSALENADIKTPLATGILTIRTIAHKKAGLGVSTLPRGRWKPVARRQRRNLMAPTVPVHITGDQNRRGFLLDKARKCRVNLALGARPHDDEL